MLHTEKFIRFPTSFWFGIPLRAADRSVTGFGLYDIFSIWEVDWKCLSHEPFGFEATSSHWLPRIPWWPGQWNQMFQKKKVQLRLPPFFGGQLFGWQINWWWLVTIARKKSIFYDSTENLRPAKIGLAGRASFFYYTHHIETVLSARIFWDAEMLGEHR